MVVKTAKTLTEDVIIKFVNDKLSLNHRLQRLQDYYEGKHDINLRNYRDTTKPNNKVVVNYCKKIAEFHTSYLVGVPVKYEAPQAILDTLDYNDEAETTQAIVRNINIAFPLNINPISTMPEPSCNITKSKLKSCANALY